MTTTGLHRHFAGSYAEARQKFLGAAAQLQLATESFVHDAKGEFGETLAIDVAWLGAPDAGQLLILSSGTHGSEGFAGSGCQVAALADAELRARFEKAGVALLLVHAINPYGFSFVRRTNEGGVDLNRNCIDFDAPRPPNDGYAELDPLLIPESWPPTPDDDAALAAYIERHGARKFHQALSGGQYTVPGGLFYGGDAPSWSNRTLRSILRRYAAAASDIAWIDLHTGLGPYGHGEKIYSGSPGAGLARARAFWGGDVFAAFEGESVSADVTGPVVSTLRDECPDATATSIALEFGVLPLAQALRALCANQWLDRHPEAPQQTRLAIRRQVLDASYGDCDEWKGMVLGQSRVALLQALQGLQGRAEP